MRKSEILNQLERVIELAQEIIKDFDEVDTSYSARTRATFNMFDLVETLSKAEISMYNYFKEK